MKIKSNKSQPDLSEVISKIKKFGGDRMKILGRIGNKFDIQTYQDLPLYIQNEILSSGEVLYFSDYKEIFDIFMKTIREFGDFKSHLELYYSNMGV